MAKLMDSLVDAAEKLDWTVRVSDDWIEFEKYSPEGEDFGFSINGTNERDVARLVREYAEDFDADEHAEMWVESRGKRGVPESIRALIDDADAIQEMVDELAEALEAVEASFEEREGDDNVS